jgi:hypothetical protein
MSTGTLNEKPIARAIVTIPEWGNLHADVVVNDGAVLTGSVELVIADLTIKGTIVPNRGGVYRERGHYQIVGGAAGWQKRIRAQAYRNDAGVKLLTVLRDAAQLAGETLGDIDPAARLGPHFVRPEGAAALVLQAVSERRWYIDVDGVTKLGLRAATTTSGVTFVDPVDPGHARLTIAAEKIAAFMPGATIDDAPIEGFVVGRVVHRLNADELRTDLWGTP